ncbi:ribose 5-phosphate isomerase A [Acidianus manzaensis]|uniref:Ribose 5-phosphate isomerase A n=1 Tax=Acidianus manzaensis TaxID=282676 RepID=A0A1W6K028_9CREN|nr:ribose 5-phosphate isomerase A [Acidianus manzaensis]ARM75876.1 ribose 5-phosphate isomerase A [Acidianus manzaensis]
MDAKEILAKRAIEYLKDSNIIGIGTGKTSTRVIKEIISNKSLFLSKRYISSSIDSEIQLSSNGFNVLSLFSGILPDIYVDSFDYLITHESKQPIMIKGGGGALLREKLLSYNAKFRLFIGEFNKIINNNHSIIKIPIEVVPVSVNYILKAIQSMNFEVEIRSGSGKMGPIISDNGNILIDINFPMDKNTELCKLDSEIHQIPGVIETGIFCNNLYDIIILADDNGKIEVIKKS